MRIPSIEDIEREKLEAQMEDNIFLKAIRFGLENPNGFSYDEIVKGLKLNTDVLAWEKNVIDKYLDSAFVNARQSKINNESGSNETPFLFVGVPQNFSFTDSRNRYTLTFDAHFKFIDYQELKLARESSREAKRLSFYAIGISVLAILVSVGIAVFGTQSVELDDTQLQMLIDALHR